MKATLRRNRSQIVTSLVPSRPTIEFRMLGPTEIRVSGANQSVSDLTQAKRLAVLAYLAAPPLRVHRRDRLLALFWPNLDTAHARGALRKSLHHIRAALGQDVIRSLGNQTLELDTNRLWCDASAFDQELSQGNLANALELYRGDLLAGLFLSDAPEFEHWLDGQRAQLRQRAFVAVRTLAAVAREAGDEAETVRWLRRALELNPSDEKVVRQLLAVLDQNGDYEGAISMYDALARHLAEDKDVPEEETRGLMEQVKANKARRSNHNGAAVTVKAPLSADDCYAKGRRLFNEFGPTAFAAAEGWFNRALDLDPNHALARSGLGSILTFRFIHRGRREDLDKALVSLQRTLELDRDAVAVNVALIGNKPHAWLPYAYTPLYLFEDIAELGGRSMADADGTNPIAHFLRAFTFVAREGRGYEPGCYAVAVPHFRRALELDSTMFPSLAMFGQVCTLNGCYDEARVLFDRAVAMEDASHSSDVRFLGGSLMRAMLHLRENELEIAEKMFVRATERYAVAKHVHSQAYVATAYCGLGEIAVRRGLYEDALAAYRQAIEAAGANPEMLGMGYLAIRARLGLATSYNALRMRRDETRQLSAALRLFNERNEYDFGWFSDACDGWAALDFARFYSRAGRVADAMAFLATAAATGWNDIRSLNVDECFACLAGNPSFEKLREELSERCLAFERSLAAS